MTALDIIVLLLIGGNGVIGFKRGFVCEALSMVALVGAILAVRLFHASVTDLLTGFIGTEGGAATLAFALIFGLTWYFGRFAAQRVGKSTKSSLLGSVDRVLGFGFGSLKGLLIATVAFVGFAILYDTIYGADARRPEWMRTSRTYPLLNASGKAMSQWLAERRKHGGVLGGFESESSNSAKATTAE
jgi:membrane protein required for colicin V production